KCNVLLAQLRASFPLVARIAAARRVEGRGTLMDTEMDPTGAGEEPTFETGDTHDTTLPSVARDAAGPPRRWRHLQRGDGGSRRRPLWLALGALAVLLAVGSTALVFAGALPAPFGLLQAAATAMPSPTSTATATPLPTATNTPHPTPTKTPRP